MKIALCDDNDIERYIIHESLTNMGYSNITEFMSANDLLVWLDSNKPDVLLLDIEMPGLKGIEAAHIIREKHPQIIIIFLTAHESYALDAFSVYAADYILKPVNTERLSQSLERVKRFSPHKEKLITFSFGSTDYSIKEADIIFIEKHIYKSSIYSTFGEYETIKSLRELESILNPEKFIRSHTGYIVNVSKISKVEARGNMSYTLFFADTEKTALLSRNRRKLFKNAPGLSVLKSEEW